MIPDYFAFAAAADVGLVGTFNELVNSARAYGYAQNAGITWLQDCRECTRAYPAGSSYIRPSNAVWAPWYHPSIPYSDEFLGLIGLEVEGGDDSTRRANVTTTLTGGGTIGAPYYRPRTLVLRALAIATSDCGLQVGLDWMQFTEADEGDPCLPPTLVFYDCCFPSGASEPGQRRGLRQARITEGPEVLKIHRTMNADVGAVATVEFTLTCGDPTKYEPGA